MDEQIDLREPDAEGEILSQTAAGGLLGGKLLHEEPLETYLADEEPLYLLRNKKSGYEIKEEDGSETVTPDGDYQAFLLVTDCRLLYVVGQDGGNHVESLPMAEIFEARVDSGGFRKQSLDVETFDGETWRFTTKSDPGEAAALIDGTAQSWVTAVRLLEDTEANVDAIESALDAGDETTAAEQVDEAITNLETADARIQEAGARARSEFTERARSVATRLLELKRLVRAEQGATAHRNALDAWQAGQFESAATAYVTAIEHLRDAIESAGSEPSTRSLRERLRGVYRERELLRHWPLVEADAHRRQALRATDPVDASAHWSTAIDGYTGMFSLEWPGDGPEFVVETKRIRAQIEACLEDAITDHYEAGRYHLERGDELAVDDDNAYTEAYESAKAAFDLAAELAAQTDDSDLVDAVQTAKFTAERRLNGNLPESLEDGVLEPLHVARGDDGEADAPANVESEPADEAAAEEEKPASPLEQIKAKKQGAGEADPATAEDDTTPTEPADSSSPRTTQPRGQTQSVRETIENAEELQAALRTLDEQEFTQLVADLWEAKGWSTTLFSDVESTVYDILAMRTDPEQRLLLWTVAGDADDVVDPTEVKRCATTRDRSQGADVAALVTSSTISPGAKREANDLDVDLYDCRELMAELHEYGLATQLLEP